MKSSQIPAFGIFALTVQCLVKKYGKHVLRLKGNVEKHEFLEYATVIIMLDDKGELSVA